MIAEWPGYCPTCEESTCHVQYGEWLRDELVCRRCASSPRLRAISYVLSLVRADWRRQRIWEVAPAGPMSTRLRDSCAAYVPTHYWTDVEPGTSRDGVRCEDVEAATFDDNSFDIIIASDVFEHVLDVHRALAEVTRVLTPDGVFIWTVPQQRDLDASRPRARRDGATIEHLHPAEYHADPVNENGVLVTFDWGRDLPAVVEEACGMTTTVVRIESKVLGILGEYREVFVSCRSAEGWAAGARREERLIAHEREIAAAMDEMSAHVEALQSELLQSATAVRDYDLRLAESERRAAAYLEETMALRGSTSWRVTRPLRALSGLVRRRS